MTEVFENTIAHSPLASVAHAKMGKDSVLNSAESQPSLISGNDNESKHHGVLSDDDFFIDGITPPTPQYAVYPRISSDGNNSVSMPDAQTSSHSENINSLMGAKSAPCLPSEPLPIRKTEKRCVSFGAIDVHIYDDSLAADGSTPDSPPTETDSNPTNPVIPFMMSAFKFIGDVIEIIKNAKPNDSDERDYALGDISENDC